jgi:hypothetical protein
MPEFTVVEKQLTNYQALRQKMSPELQESFLNACLNAGLSEDDWIHALFAFQAELFTGSLDAQMNAIRSALDGALSLRQSENKKLAELLAACQNSLKDSCAAIAKQANDSAEQIAELKTEIRNSQRIERDARKEESTKASRQHDELLRKLPDVYEAAKIVRDVQWASVHWIIAAAIAFGILLTLAVEHLILHL